MSEHPFTELHDLIGNAEIIVLAQPDLLDLVVRGIKHLAADESDPFHTLGVLVEGVVHLLATSVPADRRYEAVQAVRTMLRDRLAACDLI